MSCEVGISISSTSFITSCFIISVKALTNNWEHSLKYDISKEEFLFLDKSPLKINSREHIIYIYTFGTPYTIYRTTCEIHRAHSSQISHSAQKKKFLQSDMGGHASLFTLYSIMMMVTYILGTDDHYI